MFADMKYSLCFIFALLLLPSSNTYADNIILAADKWCPYNCEPNTKQEGYLIDIARIIFEKAGHTLTYQTTNWSRAVADAKAGKINGVVGALPEEVPGFILTTTPLGISQDHFYVLAKNPWRYQNNNSLANIKLAVINHYGYDPDITAFIKEHIEHGINNEQHRDHLHVASGENALENNIHMVIQGHVDAIIEDQNVLTLTANKMGVTNQLVDAGSSGFNNPIYIAFSPNNPKSNEYAKLLSSGIAALRQSGELEKILSLYGMKDWESQ